ncbi:MAG: hypothetical protein KDE33_02955 [Bacteroidetes bacterium]|nr:hypothetical protein [Bacteroidota bacterium]
MKRIIIPSVLNYDFNVIKTDLIELFENGVTHIHFDVLDGSLTQDIFDGFEYISSMTDIFDKYQIAKNIHLLTKHPENYLPLISKINVQQLSFHSDLLSQPECDSLFNQFKNFADEVGIVINPSSINDNNLLSKIDFAHVCNKDYFTNTIYTNDELAFIISSIKSRSKQIQIDGGVTSKNIKFYRDLGATFFISGGGIFSNQPLNSYLTLLNILEDTQ